MPGAEEHDGPAALADRFGPLCRSRRNADDPLDAPVRIEPARDFARAPCLRRGERAKSVDVLDAESLDQQGHMPAAALAEIGAERLSNETGGPAPAGERVAGLGEKPPLELASADGAVKSPIRAQDHARALPARRRALDLVHADEGGRAMRRDDPGKARKSLHAKGLPRTASQARRTASGVAGASSGTGFCGSSARTASASAQNTLCASINGGSPTAFER